jgi:hypothetical protein
MDLQTAREEMSRMKQTSAKYSLDVFALLNGQSYAGLPVYDLGFYNQPK